MLAYFTFYIGDSFFWSNNEVHQGICWAFMSIGYFYSLLGKQKIAWWQYSIVVLLLFLGISSHLLVSIPVLFLVVTKSLEKAEYKWNKLTLVDYLSVVVVLFCVCLKMYMSSFSGYDDSKLGMLKSMNWSDFLGVYSNNHAKDYVENITSRSFPVLLVAIVSLCITIYQRKWTLLILCVGALVGYYTLIFSIYNYSMPKDIWFYIESEYQVTTIILLAPIVYLFRSDALSKIILPSVLSLAIVFMIGRLYIAYDYFNNRFENLEKLVNYCAAQSLHKVIIKMNEVDAKEYFIMDWGVPIETLSYSKAIGITPLSVKILRPDDSVSEHSIAKDNSLFMSAFKEEPIKLLNSKYFVLDSLSDYKVIELPEGLLQRCNQ